MTERLTGERLKELDIDPADCSASEVASLLDEVEAQRESLRKYHLLRDAVNDCAAECLPGCSSYGHEEQCPRVHSAHWLEERQATIEAQRKALEVLVKTWDDSPIRPHGRECALHGAGDRCDCGGDAFLAAIKAARQLVKEEKK